MLANARKDHSIPLKLFHFINCDISEARIWRQIRDAIFPPKMTKSQKQKPYDFRELGPSVRIIE